MRAAGPGGARRAAVRVTTLALCAALCAGLSGCGLFEDDEPGEVTSVFEVGVGTCLRGPTEVTADITEVDTVPCTEPHTQEAYALVTYEATGATAAASGDPQAALDADLYPGEQVLTDFANGVCAERFTDYVGRSYLDSALFFSFLTPTPRSWEEGDRQVLCVLTDPGRPLTASLKGADR
ncbi:septum formation family protein [Nocardioides sp.]|uniref:septum formation family protein n=1 Tax=Nocardioides sp. TaxID=35761 RepID=UPI0035118526